MPPPFPEYKSLLSPVILFLIIKLSSVGQDPIIKTPPPRVLLLPFCIVNPANIALFDSPLLNIITEFVSLPSIIVEEI